LIDGWFLEGMMSTSAPVVCLAWRSKHALISYFFAGQFVFDGGEMQMVTNIGEPGRPSLIPVTNLLACDLLGQVSLL
jgi:hypothetical protein